MKKRAVCAFVIRPALETVDGNLSKLAIFAVSGVTTMSPITDCPF